MHRYTIITKRLNKKAFTIATIVAAFVLVGHSILQLTSLLRRQYDISGYEHKPTTRHVYRTYIISSPIIG